MPAEVQPIDIQSDSFEPKRTHRWLFEVDGQRWYWAKTVSRPSAAIEAITIDYINSKRYLAGKMEWNTITVSCYDPISPSVTQKAMEWIRLCYENLSGRAGYGSFYKKTVNLSLLDPIGVKVENWLIEGAWVTNATFGDLDYASAEAVNVDLELRYDRAILQY